MFHFSESDLLEEVVACKEAVEQLVDDFLAPLVKNMALCPLGNDHQIHFDMGAEI